jgi:SAM-dependent methyltransferase
MFEKRVMTSMYEKARSPADLPWHQSEPPEILVRAVEGKAARGRALDLGCGAGTFAVYLAKQGFEVTAIDMIPRAIELAGALAHAEGARVTFVAADLLQWEAPTPFDLVLDSGCLHSLMAGSPRLYKKRLLDWVVPGGDFVLGHWGKRHAMDWRPIGPRRRTRHELRELFAPELEEHAHHEQLMTGVPMPFGPSVLGVGMWFKRATS